MPGNKGAKKKHTAHDKRNAEESMAGNKGALKKYTSHDKRNAEESMAGNKGALKKHTAHSEKAEESMAGNKGAKKKHTAHSEKAEESPKKERVLLKNWPRNEREVLVVSFLRACTSPHYSARPRDPSAIDIIRNASAVLGEVMCSMSMHVARMGCSVGKEEPKPIPMTLCASIPVHMWFRKQASVCYFGVCINTPCTCSSRSWLLLHFCRSRTSAQPPSWIWS